MVIQMDAQTPKYDTYTIKDGLPSNYIYGTVEDDKGFLWVATDAGIARFDGKYFQVFTTNNGLPDNEVLAVVKENDGTIWVNCFKQAPAYFDEITNRFIVPSTWRYEDKSMGTSFSFVYPLKNGGVTYYSENGCITFKDKKLVDYAGTNKDLYFLINDSINSSQLFLGIKKKSTSSGNTYSTLIYEVKNKELVDSLTFETFNNVKKLFGYPSYSDGKLYFFINEKKKCFVYSNWKINPISYSRSMINLTETNYQLTFSKDFLIFYSINGIIQLYNKKTLQLERIIKGDYLPNSLNTDSRGNLWVATIEKGLVRYRIKSIKEMPLADNLKSTHFLSIARRLNGKLLVGNFYGQILETNYSGNIVHPSPDKKIGLFRQRKIVISQGKVFSFSENGVFKNFENQLTSPDMKLYWGKTAINYNDSIIIVGNHYTLLKLNTITEEGTLLNTIAKRVTALCKTIQSIIYVGSTDGLYKYDYAKNQLVTFSKKNNLLKSRVVSITYSQDNLLWVATASNGIVVLKNDSVVLNITEKQGIISNSLRSVLNAKPGEIWVGTNKGLSIIHYKYGAKKVNFQIQNLTVKDGLTSDIINEMIYVNDTVFAATGNGISVIPVSISLPKFNIPVFVTQIKINQRDTIISNKYELLSNQQDIFLQFAAVELNGHYKNLIYSIDGSPNWIALNENNLNLNLNHGKHVLRVKAVDVNGNISDKMLTLHFNIAVPFYKQPIFWVIVILVIQMVTFLLLFRFYKKEKEKKLALKLVAIQTASLEQQAFTSLMNPHFIFNALNSIQYFINKQDRQNANRYLSDFASLIRKNFEGAQQSFIPLEQELENIKIYLRLEQMRFTNEFTYQINVNENVDLDNWQIPTMMLQPLIENALIHGIMNSSIAGIMTIDIIEQNENLIIAIIDNGIGMENSKLFHRNNLHKSHGMTLIKKRIKALNYFVKQPIELHSAPAFADEKNPGNKTTLLIPSDLYDAWLKAQHE